MKEMHQPFIGLREKKREETLDKGSGISFTGLVYDVEYKRFHVAYKDPATGRIRIECRCHEGTQELFASISAV